MTPEPSRIDHLECSACGATAPFRQLQRLCACGAPWLVRYRLGPDVPRPPHAGPGGMWRYAGLLPHLGEIVTLGEGQTPVLAAPRLGAAIGVPKMFVKDESRNPTTSFKARGIAAAVTMAKALGARRLAIPTAGNAGGALAAYGARAGLEVDVFMPADTPEPFALEAEQHGARVHRVRGLINDCGAEVAKGLADGRWFDLSTLKEPYRIEGKKTMGYEIAEQFPEQLPNVILYPTGGGTGLVGIAKAFEELSALGWHCGPRPRLVTVQVAGCAPIVRAFQEGAERARPWEHATTMAYGLRVPAAVGDRLMLRAVRESGGTGIAVGELEMLAGMQALGTREGIPCGPETGALVAAAASLAKSGWITPEETVLMISTGSGHKYPDSQAAAKQAAPLVG
ncbi:MAG: threonine synthase [Planctomycetota bacterium]